MARIPMLETEETAPVLQELFNEIEKNGSQVLHLYKTLAHAPYLCRDVIRLGNKLLNKGKLPEDLRELAILQVSHLTHATYERVKHEEIGRRVGLSQEKIDAITDWENTTLFDAKERAVLRFSQETTQAVRASSQIFDEVLHHLGEVQVVELTVTIGFYNMISRILETLGVELEPNPLAL